MQKKDDLPVIYSCSGCSDAGELADRVARELNRDQVGEMSCLAGIGGRVKPLMLKAQRAERIVVIDGCPLNCARHTLANAGFSDMTHIELHKLGHRKGSCPVTNDRVHNAAAAARKIILDEDSAEERAGLCFDGGVHLYDRRPLAVESLAE